MKVPSLVKYKKLSKSVFIILKVVYWIALVLTILSFLLNIGVRFLPDNFHLFDYSSNGVFGISPDNIIQFEIAQERIAGVNLNPIYSALFVGIFISLLLVTIVLRQLKGIAKNVVDNKPFDEENAKSILYTGYAVIAGSLLIPISKAYTFNKIIHAFDLSNVRAVYTINLEVLFIGILLILLSSIFHYGAYLQQEYDTTL